MYAQTDSITIHQNEKVINITSDTLIQAEKSVPDSIKRRPHFPRRATIYSLCLPGLGQAYNRKYWKVPVVYAGLGTLGYFIYFNNKRYHSFLDAYKFVVNGETGPPPNEMVERYNGDAEKLRTIKNYYLRNLEISYIATGLFYIIQVIDAAVDAHFFYFDVDENLSLQISPEIFQPLHSYTPPVAGVSLVFNLK